MENWGLVTVKEIVLMDNKENSYFLKSYSAQVIVHELAHQWFGNLVTMDWWNDLWLNEGFATWVQYNMTSILLPETDFAAIFTHNSLHYVFKTDFDGQATAVASKDHFENISMNTFSLIVYNKGSAIINNLQREYLHPDEFRSALRHYMSTHAYGNAKSSDLWHSMELYSKEPVTQFMESWLYQEGHPILSVDVKKGFLTIQQSVYTHDILKLENPDRRWIIPVTVLVSDGESRQEVISVTLTGQQQEEVVNLPEWYNPKVSNHWLKLNCNATGLYNVEYSDILLNNLRRPIQKKLMNPLDRLDLLINYALVFVADQYKKPVELENFLKWYKKEDNYTVFLGLLRVLNIYGHEEKSKKLFSEIFNHYLEDKSLMNDPSISSYNDEIRSQILFEALQSGHRQTIKSFLKKLDNTKPLDSIREPTRSHLFDSVFDYGTSKHKKQLQAMINNMNDSPVKVETLEKLEELLKIKKVSTIRKLLEKLHLIRT